MNDLIQTGNPSLILYEELLLKKENLRKEGSKIYICYLQVFGPLLTEAFRRKIECIRKKKMIAFCQKCVNHGKDINQTDLNDFAEREMRSYEEELRRLMEEEKAAREAKAVSLDTLRRIKEIYYRLARKIHPDMRPELAGDAVLFEYWNRIAAAYEHNQLQELEELEVLVNRYLETKQIRSGDIVIADIEKKIRRLEEEIERIISAAPYTFRFLLENEKQRKEKEEALQREIDEYEQYSSELDVILKSFPVRNMYA